MKENGEIKGVIGEKGNKVKIKSLRKNYAKVIFLNSLKFFSTFKGSSLLWKLNEKQYSFHFMCG